MQVSINVKLDKDIVTNGDIIQSTLKVKNISVTGALVFVDLKPFGQARFDLDWWNACAVSIGD